MSTPRLPMRRIREVLRLKHERGLTHREVAQACSISIGAVTLYVRRAAAHVELAAARRARQCDVGGSPVSAGRGHSRPSTEAIASWPGPG